VYGPQFLFSNGRMSLAAHLGDGTGVVWDITEALSAEPVDLPRVGAKDDPGELQIYRTLQEPMKTAAARIFRDSDGVLSRAILYRLREGIDPQATYRFTEDMLVPYRVCLLKYDEAGNHIKTEQYTPDMEFIEAKDVVPQPNRP